MTVGVADGSDPITHLEGVLQNPFECSPGRMHFHGFFHPAVMRNLHVRVAPTTMGKAERILIVFDQFFKEFAGSTAIGIGIAQIIDERVRRAVDWSILGHIEHIAVAAEEGIT